ncbi:MAG: MgtC/SapB family protein [Acidithiobacillus sp.]|uniref:MgtC/SapB family protein n=2 Tax=Acidithiobacillus sp. TaxID=1872118 RepID=UPI003D044F42
MLMAAQQELLATTADLALAFVLGALIGVERQWRQRTAGLRTNTLVAVGAAIFVNLGWRIGGDPELARIVAYVISGIGFLGAGTIMKEGVNVRGLNTAATIWGSAAVGACAGSGQWAPAIIAAAFVLAANTLLRPVANQINRLPTGDSTETTATVFLIVRRGLEGGIQEQASDILDAAGYPVREFSMRPFGSVETEMRATLLPSHISEEELDRAIHALEQIPGVQQIFWNQNPGGG